jgi:hypothetical protein
MPAFLNSIQSLIRVDEKFPFCNIELEESLPDQQLYVSIHAIHDLTKEQ